MYCEKLLPLRNFFAPTDTNSTKLRNIFAACVLVALAGCDSSTESSTSIQYASDRTTLATGYTVENYGLAGATFDLNNAGQAVWVGDNNALNFLDNGNIESLETFDEPTPYNISVNESGDLTYTRFTEEQTFYLNGERQNLLGLSDVTTIQNLHLADNGAASWFQLARTYDPITLNARLLVDIFYVQLGDFANDIESLPIESFRNRLFDNSSDDGVIAWANYSTGEIFTYDGNAISPITSAGFVSFPADLTAEGSDGVGNKLLSVNGNGEVVWIGTDATGTSGLFKFDGTNSYRIANPNPDTSGQLNINNSGQIVWVDDNTVYRYENGTTNAISDSAKSPGITWLQQNESDDVAWADKDGSGTDIYAYNSEGIELVKSVSYAYARLVLNNDGQVAFNSATTLTIATPGTVSEPGPGTNDGTTGVLTDLNQWDTGYIATFECNIDVDSPDSVLIDFNYTGSGNTALSWMLSWIGDVDTGLVGTDNGYAIRTTGNGYQPTLSAGQTIGFQILVRNAPYADSDFDVRCITDTTTDPQPEPEPAGGSSATLNNLNQWETGYIATFECNLQSNAPNGMLIDFNYTGSGNTASSWMLTWIGNIETGPVGTNGGYAIRTTGVGYQPALNAGKLVTFEILVRNASYAEADFDTRCVIQ